ncbi:disease resistance protein SUMM2-like [Gossypium arboreum]|uniref:disease resistance protein SUMM2-like n=1 Tax=Gossypium arboreum TaxID=29729 RepID=UPI0008193F50|nr:disease resistance protein SUMM2-like [Gossypium arboreum]
MVLVLCKELVEQAGTVFEVGNTIWGLIENHWKFPKGIDQNVNNLKRKRDQLNGQKEDIESRIKSELRPRKKVKKEFDLWIENVKRINREIPNFESKVRGNSFFSRGFLVKNVRKKKLKSCLKRVDFLMIWLSTIYRGLIGVYEMPGVGKISVVTLVNNELLKGEIKFKIVVWVTVARKSSVIELQNKIAKAMNVNTSEDDEDETLRARICLKF